MTLYRHKILFSALNFISTAGKLVSSYNYGHSLDLPSLWEAPNVFLFPRVLFRPHNVERGETGETHKC